MIIKAKYPSLERPYMRTVKQGFGSIYGGNQISDVANQDRLENIFNTSTENMFEGSKIFTYINLNTGQELVFTNESAFLINQSETVIIEIDTVHALEFINESNWVPSGVIDPIDTLLESLEARSQYFENETSTRELLNNLNNCKEDE